MKDCKHEYRMQPDENGIVLCHHCNYPISKEEDKRPWACCVCGTSSGVFQTDAEIYICSAECLKELDCRQGMERQEHNKKVDDKQKLSGTKNDAGKPDLSLFPREAIEAGSRAFMFGIKKYGTRNGWKKETTIDGNTASLLRHIFAWKDGEKVDKDSGLDNLDLAMARLAMLITLYKE